MKRKVWALFLLALAGFVYAQPPTTTTYVGTVKDLTGATVTSGRITWQLNAPQGGVIPGTGSFVSTTVSCSINASGHPVSTTDGTSPCLITNNTALTPTGTSYTMCIQPQFVSPGSCIVTYAIGGTIDISTVVPTPTTGPFNYAGTPGPPGPPGPTGPTGPDGGVMPGWVQTGSGTSQVDTAPGTVAAGTAITAPLIGTNPTTPVGAPTTVPNIIGGISALRPAALRSTMTKTQGMGLNANGLAGYTTPYQLIMLMGGDSTTGFHSAAMMCTLAAQYNVAGYILSSPSGTATQYGWACPSMGYFAPTLAGGAVSVTGDFAHFIGGNGYRLPTGASLTSTNSYNSTRQLVFYTADAAGATITISTSPDNITYTALSTCNGVAVSASVGAVCDQTIAAGSYYLKIAASGGTVYVWGAGQINTAVNGVVGGILGVGGTSLPDQASTPTAITQPWYNAIHPDLVTFEMKANGVLNANCDQATTAAPSAFHDRAYWWTRWIAPWQTANPLVDTLYFGSYSIGDADTCLPKWNQYSQQWAYSQNPEQTYIDNYWQLTNTQMQSLGWIDASVHETPLGQAAHSALDMIYLGLLSIPTATVRQPVVTGTLETPAVYIGSGSSVNGVGAASGQQQLYIHGDTSHADIYAESARNLLFNAVGGATTYMCLGANAPICPAAAVLRIGTSIMTLNNPAVTQQAASPSFVVKATTLNNTGGASLNVNKGAAAAYGSLGFQDNGVAKATIGLLANDDLTFWNNSSVATMVMKGTAPAGSMTINADGTTSLNAVRAATLYSAAGTALPSCAAGTKGDRAVVTDATTPTYMGAYTSGGAITAEVICSYNGSTYSWLMH